MDFNKSTLAVAIAATLGGASTADAAVFPVALYKTTTYTNNGSSSADLSSSTATFQYDDVTNLVTQTGGIFEDRTSIVPNVVTLFRHTITGLVLGNGAPAGATTYTCVVGNFGDITGAHLCGNYNFGVNFANESTVSYGPGTAFAKTIGGDDMDIGPQQSINQLNNMTSAGVVGTILTLSNAGAGPGTGAFPNIGYNWEFSTNAADTDGDGKADVNDNCRTISNPVQIDSNGDGFGNRCDGDLNNNGATNAQDYVLFRQQLGQPSIPPLYNAADINANGAVNAQDYVLFRGLLGSPPGPGKATP